MSVKEGSVQVKVHVNAYEIGMIVQSPIWAACGQNLGKVLHYTLMRWIEQSATSGGVNKEADR